jgi:hypothetical protein
MYLYKPSENAQSEPVDFYFERTPPADVKIKYEVPQKTTTKRAKPVKNTDDDGDPSSSTN